MKMRNELSRCTWIATIGLVVSFLLGIVLADQWADREWRTAVAEQALVDISRHLTLLRLHGQNAPAPVRAEIDLNIHRHLINVMRYEVANTEQSMKYKSSVLKKLSAEWRQYPPFAGAIGEATRTGMPEVAESLKTATEFVHAQGQ